MRRVTAAMAVMVATAVLLVQSPGIREKTKRKRAPGALIPAGISIDKTV